MKKRLERLRIFFLSDLWSRDRLVHGRTQTFLINALRTVIVVAKDVLLGDLTLRAMGLVYTTLLSLVPLLAVSFSVLKAFGVHHTLEPFLNNVLTPLGPWGFDLTERIVEFVNNMKVGVLGFVGLGLLIYTVISLVQKIEESFNAIWRVRSLRSILQRFRDYLSVILVGPVLVVSALGFTASLLSSKLMQKFLAVEPFGTIVSAAGQLVPYVLVCIAFAFIYVFVPNTKVRLIPAVIGAVIGGVLWQAVGWGFASFIVGSTRYGAIYSGFAVLILFMIWMYLSWLILLIGAEISFYVQNPQYLVLAQKSRVPDARLIEQTAVSVMLFIAQSFHDDKPPWTTAALAQHMGIDVERVEEIVEALKTKGLIAEITDDPPAYLPRRDLEAIMLHDVYGAVRGTVVGLLEGSRTDVSGQVEEVVRSVDQAITTVLDGRTLKDIVRSPVRKSGEGNGKQHC
ncbi:MAG: YhjD/YihY/BrkB family envelope integrity protein [Nitrospirota bacterium]